MFALAPPARSVHATVKTTVHPQPPAPERMIMYQCRLRLGINREHTVGREAMLAPGERIYAHSFHCSEQRLVKPYQNRARGCLLSILMAFK